VIVIILANVEGRIVGDVLGQFVVHGLELVERIVKANEKLIKVLELVAKNGRDEFMHHVFAPIKRVKLKCHPEGMAVVLLTEYRDTISLCRF